MRGPRAFAAGVVLAAAALLLAAAPDVSAAGTAPSHGPGTSLVGLVVKRENVTKTLAGQQGAGSYIDQTELYSLRDRTNLLEATLQISRLKQSAPSSSPAFQLNLVSQVGSARPIVLRVRGVSVYVTSLRTLRLACWFRAGHLFVLAVRDTFGQPKALLWDALEVKP